MYLIQALRPLQWVKNGLIFLPFLFAVDLAWSPDDLARVPGILARLTIVLGGFCALSSAAYLLNDIMDRRADRSHPVKRFRPIASGKVPVPLAGVLMVCLGVAGLGTTALVNPLIAGMGVLYLIINVAYSLGIKNVALVDVLSVASGYVIRAGVGAVAIEVVASPWLYAVTAAGALFIVLGRRYAEVRLAGEEVDQQRPVLSSYAGPFMGQLLTISATATLVCYTLYTVEANNLPANQTMLLTVPFVVFGVFRYLYLLNTSPQAESPEHLFSRDVPLLASILCWIGVSALVLLLNG